MVDEQIYRNRTAFLGFPSNFTNRKISAAPQSGFNKNIFMTKKQEFIPVEERDTTERDPWLMEQELSSEARLYEDEPATDIDAPEEDYKPDSGGDTT